MQAFGKIQGNHIVARYALTDRESLSTNLEAFIARQVDGYYVVAVREQDSDEWIRGHYVQGKAAAWAAFQTRIAQHEGF